jgi:uncharacterized membrane protein
MSDHDREEVTIYLADLHRALRGLPAFEQDEIVNEIAAHIRDRVAEDNISAAVALAGLGSVEQIADHYREGAILEQARSSISPLSLLHGLFVFARRGFLGTVALLAALFGYLSGAALVITALLKLVVPQHVGLWFGSHRFLLGLTSTTPQYAPEMLGLWYTPIMGIFGILLLWLTTLGSRAFLNHARQWMRNQPSWTTRSGVSARG